MEQRCVSVELTEKEQFKAHYTQVVSASTPKSRSHFLPVVEWSSYLKKVPDVYESEQIQLA